MEDTDNSNLINNHNESTPMINPNRGGRDGEGLTISKRLNQDYGEKFINNPRDRAGGYSNCIRCCGNIPKFLCVVCSPCECGPVKKINTGEIGLLLEFGRLVRKLEPGLHSFNQCSQEIFVVKLLTQILDIPPQTLITRDNVTIRVDSFLTYRVAVPELAQFKVSNYKAMLNSIAQGILKNVVVERSLSELLSERKEVEEQIIKEVSEKTEFFGVEVILLELQGITLQGDMTMAMSQVTMAELEAESKIVVAEGNLNSSKIYGKAADLMRGNPISLQLQYFETIKVIAAENNKTYIMPDKLIRLFQA